MNKKTIEHSFSRGDFAASLEALKALPPSAWRDTTTLRCLRSLSSNKERGKQATAFAEKLLAQYTEGAPYATTRSERNNQRRYIALVLAEQGQAKKACSIMKALVAKSPDLAALQQEYAFALNACGQLDLAEQALYRALALQPSNVRAHTQLARIQCRTGRVRAGFDGYLRAATLESDNPEHHEHLLYWSNYLASTTQQSNYQLARVWASKKNLRNQRTHFTRKADHQSKNEAAKQIRLAFVSSNLCAHPVSFFIKPLLRGLDKSQFNITAYHMGDRTDAVSAQIQSLCDKWDDVSRLSTDKLIQKITQDSIDILIDLNGHSAGARLDIFAKRSAPIQMSWLGYPSTTGLANMDFRITDRIADPVGLNDDFYSEQLLRLPNGFLCYEPLSTAPKVAPQLKPEDNSIKFGSFNSLAKISDLSLDSWAAALHAVPNSTICIKRQQLRNQGPKDYLLAEFEKRGIEGERVELLTSTSSIEAHFNEYNRVDVALDTSPYNGTTTMLEALWMGVPVLSLQQNTHASRVSASLLQSLELSHLATTSVQAFAQQAELLTHHRETLLDLKHGLRERMRQSPLLDHKRFGRDFGSTLRQQWRNWCAQNPSQGIANEGENE